MDIKHTVKRVFSLFLVLVAAMTIVATPAFAKTVSSMQDENEKLQQQIKENKKKLDDLKNQKDKQLEYMDAIDEKIAIVQQQVDNYQNQITELNKQINEVEAQIKTEQENYEKTYDEYEQRMRANYMAGGTSTLEILLEAGDMSKLLTTIELINRVTEHDEAMLKELQAKLDSINAKKASLKEKQESLQTSLKEVEDKKAEIQKDKDEIQSVIAELQKSQDYYTEKIEEDEKKQQELEDEINSIINNNGGVGEVRPGTGVFTNPCPGYRYISAGYPNYASGRYHGGVDFAASHGKPIVAADSGTVISVKRLNYSYGYHVIISHGNGLTTLYAHASALYVSVGQHVTKGQKIAAVGQTGNASGNHLHFEVRKNGTRVNPFNYVKL